MQSLFGLRRLTAIGAVSFCLVFASRPADADVTATWTGTMAGQWTDPTNWSTNPYYPNNGNPAGVNYDVSISTASLHAAQLGLPVTIDNLTLNGSLETSQDLTASTVTFDVGWMMLNSPLITQTLNIDPSGQSDCEIQGEIDGATINANSYGTESLNLQGAVFANATLNTDIYLGSEKLGVGGGSVAFAGTLNANGHTINAQEGEDTLTFDGNGSAFTLSNINILLGGNIISNCYIGTDDMPGTSLVIAPSATINAAFLTYIGDPDSPSIVNEGTIVSNNQGDNASLVGVFIRPQAFTNTGTIYSQNAAYIQIAPAGTSWTNNGVLSAADGGGFSVPMNLTFADGSSLDAVIGVLYGGRGVLLVTGNLDLGDDTTLNLSLAADSTFTSPYLLAQYTGTLTGEFANVTPGFVISYATPGEILVTAVPEPASLAFLIAASILLLGRRSRADRKCL
jgi:hypothetical protein